MHEEVCIRKRKHEDSKEPKILELEQTIITSLSLFLSDSQPPFA